MPRFVDFKAVKAAVTMLQILEHFSTADGVPVHSPGCLPTAPHRASPSAGGGLCSKNPSSSWNNSPSL
jgi:hypothetical protein